MFITLFCGLCLNKPSSAVGLTKYGLFDLARGISRHFRKYYSLRTLVSRECVTEFVYLFLCRFHSLFYLYYSRRNLAESFVGKSDYRHVLDLCICIQEVFNFNGIQVFTARNNDVLLTVNKINKSILVDTRNVARIKPTVLQYVVCRLLVLIIAKHYTVALDDQLADTALGKLVALLVDNFCLPVVTGCTHPGPIDSDKP